MWRNTILQVFVLINVCYIMSIREGHAYEFERCEPMDNPMCESMPYNMTILPNMFGYDRQQFASDDMDDFKPLIDSGCHSHLRLFLCSLLAPVCTNVPKPILPCKEFCMQVEKRCSKKMQRLYYIPEWPYYLRCDQFPEKDKALCIPKPPRDMKRKDMKTPVLHISGWATHTDQTTAMTRQQTDITSKKTRVTPGQIQTDSREPISIASSTQPTKASHQKESISNSEDTCQFIKISMCQNNVLPYNKTILPNLLNHMTQNEAENEMIKFKAIVESGCDPSFRLFLCSLYAPVCTPLKEPILPCHSLCHNAKTRCRRVLKKVMGIRWPDAFNCRRFPKKGVCILSESSFRTPLVSCD